MSDPHPIVRPVSITELFDRIADVTQERNELRARVAALTDERGRLKVMGNDYDMALGKAQAKVAALTAALATAKTLWFNALFDQGTPRDLHIQWYNEWLAKLDAAGGA